MLFRNKREGTGFLSSCRHVSLPSHPGVMTSPDVQERKREVSSRERSSSSPAMQFYSLHHCVLLFLILTFTTAPVSALEVCPTRGKLHQPVTLSCKYQCSRPLKWSLLSDRDVVQAQCGQTSCWSEPGFNISHDQYLRGDLSLTITAADYSQRKVYACECGDIDYAYVRLVIETVLSVVQMKFHEDLKLHVSVPEPVEVIYKSSGSADEVICRVNNLSLQCKDEYRDRTSLTYPEITLRHVEPRDSGSYTIRDTENEQDIQIYAVSVEGPGFPVWGIVLIVLILLICAAVGMYPLWKHLMRKQLERRKQLVDQFVQQAVGGTEEKIREAEKSLIQLMKQYINTEYSDEVTVFCREKRKQLLERRKQLVDQFVQQAVGGTEKIREVEESLNQLMEQYIYTEYSAEVSVFCSEKRKQLLNRLLLGVVQFVQQVEEGKQEISDVEKKIDDLDEKYWGTVYILEVKPFCDMKMSQLKWYSLQHEEHRVTEKREMNIRLVLVDQLVQRDKGGTEEEINEVKRKIDQLEQLYRNTEYYKQVKVLCEIKRKQLDTGGPQYVAMTEETPLKKEMNDVEQCVHEAIEGVKEKMSEAEEKIYQLEQHMTREDFVKVSEFCMYMRAELFWSRLLHSDKDQLMTDNIELDRRLLGVVQSVQQVEEGKQEISEVEKEMDDLEKSCRGTVYILEVKRFCDMKRSQLDWYRLQHEEHRVTEKRELNSRLVLVDQLVQRYKGGTEEEINEVRWKIYHLQQLYKNTDYYKQVKVLCEIKRKQLDRGGPQYVAMTEETPLEKEMIDVEQCVHEAIEGGKEKMSEAEEKIYQLEQHMTREDVMKVSEFCMYMRAELFWSRLLHSDKFQIMTDNIEILWKVEEVMDSLQKVRDGVKREQKIQKSTEVDKMKKHLMEFVKWCEETRRRTALSCSSTAHPPPPGCW